MSDDCSMLPSSFKRRNSHNRRYHCGFDRAFLCQSSLPELTNVDFSVTLRFFTDALIYMQARLFLMQYQKWKNSTTTG
jgi:hypothetical protein